MNRVVITGGSGDLGRAIAMAFGGPSEAIQAPGRDELDVSDQESIQSYFKGREIDLLVCAAGIIRDGPLATQKPAIWEQVMAVNFRGAAQCAAAVLPTMVTRGHGHMVFISSHSALHPPAGQAAYAASKAALLGLTTALAEEHGPAGIRVNAVLPGFMQTKMTAEVSSKRREQVLADHALGRFNTPTAVAKFIRFLHRELPHTSGQVFSLDSRIS
jgi:3-oxoacyl-[acyl-carrier protein] reductase